MRGRLVLAPLVVVGSLVSLEGLAAAQTGAKRAEQPIETWVFPDDKLLDVKPLGGEGKVMAGPHVVRIILTRPRTQFVPEMLKSIESL
ncbi:MAG: hypothetical protein HYV09_36455 [Deltaproteobacteria bacterium]|nr:hypothetical protein [Deltaproteobacteria bacterium]